MTDKPKIELRNIRVLTSMSEETHCYEGTLYVDGERWGAVGNAGHGGPDDFHPVEGRAYADLRALDLRIAASYPAEEFHGRTIECSLEILCGKLVNDHLLEKEYRRILKRPTYIGKDGQPRSYKVPRGANCQQVIDHLKKSAEKAGQTIEFLNELPFEDAKAKLQEAGL